MDQRPVIPSARIVTETSKEEAFQNVVIRPIIKMKHDLLISLTKFYLSKKKPDFIKLSVEKRIHYLRTCFDQDHTLRSECRGLIIGHFSASEFEAYRPLSTDANKRMLSIIKERMIDHVEDLST